MDAEAGPDRDTIRDMKIDVVFEVARRVNSLFRQFHPWVYHTLADGRFEKIESMEARLAKNERRGREDGRGDPGTGPSSRAC